MNRAVRILHRLLTALSLLLLLATAGVWARSYWVSDAFIWNVDSPDDRDHHWIFLECSRGGARLAFRRDQSEWSVPPDLSVHCVLRAEAYPLLENPQHAGLDQTYRSDDGLGFQWATIGPSVFRPGLRLRSLTLPLCFLCLLFAILPSHYWLRVRRRRRIVRRLALGCCIGCGYDLRASCGRCPECGMAVASISGGK
jgi:hypothetical protein